MRWKFWQTYIHVTDLKHWIGEEQPVPDVVQEFGARTADCVELQDFLGGLRLAGSALPRDQDEVVVELRLHGAEDVICQRITESTGTSQPQSFFFFSFFSSDFFAIRKSLSTFVMPLSGYKLTGENERKWGRFTE